VTRRPADAWSALTLLGVTAAWGSTFFLIKDLLEQISVLDFLAIRFAIATVALFLLAPRAVGRMTPDEVRHGIALGGLYGLAQVLQTLGLDRTPATVSGFVTGMYVVATPLLAAALFRERIGRVVWLAVAASTVGLAFLSLNGVAVSFGVILIFISTPLFALHIIGLGRWSTPSNVFGLAIVQMAVNCLVCSAATAPDGISTGLNASGWLSILYMAVIAGALGLLGQTWAQAHISSTRAAIIMAMEPVWAAFFAILFGGETLTGRMIVGGALVLAAMYLVELGPRRPEEQDVAAEVGGVAHVGPV
jgi:drug/metabolite transporter (DMT)-like permease